MAQWLEWFRRSALSAFLRWCVVALLVGLCAGGVGALFGVCLRWTEHTRGLAPWLLYLLPAGGLLITLLYQRFGARTERGTNMILAAVRSREEIPPATTPLIFVSTCVTHLLGGSAGREGAALQIGGGIAHLLGRRLHMDETDLHVLVMSGMAAAFSALFGTPATAVVFALEITTIGAMHYAAIVPCTLASLTGALLAHLFGLEAAHFSVALPAVTPLLLVQALLLGIAAAGISILFVVVLHRTGHLLQRWLPNAYLRAAAGGAAVVLLTLLVGARDYNGTGAAVIASAISGQAHWYDAPLKLLFTAITLGAGYRGGEIVPSFFVGATAGCVLGGLIGLAPACAAALGLIAVFCGVTNCPIASVLLGVELFGADGLLLYLIVCAVSYMLSGYGGLYSAQRILYSKTRDEYREAAPEAAPDAQETPGGRVTPPPAVGVRFFHVPADLIQWPLRGVLLCPARRRRTKNA